MFDHNTPIYVTIGLNIEDARQLEEIIRPLIDIYDDVDSLKLILDTAVQIQKLPSIIEAHDVLSENENEDEYDEELNFDGIRYPHTNLIQNWRMN